MLTAIFVENNLKKNFIFDFTRHDKQRAYRRSDPLSERIYPTREQARAPCDSCKFWEQCKAEQLACEEFSRFVYSNVKTKPPTEMQATRALFNSVFSIRKRGRIKKNAN